MLHQADATGAANIAVAPIPDHGIGTAIIDQLTRAPPQDESQVTPRCCRDRRRDPGGNRRDRCRHRRQATAAHAAQAASASCSARGLVLRQTMPIMRGPRRRQPRHGDRAGTRLDRHRHLRDQRHADARADHLHQRGKRASLHHVARDPGDILQRTAPDRGSNAPPPAAAGASRAASRNWGRACRHRRAGGPAGTPRRTGHLGQAGLRDRQRHDGGISFPPPDRRSAAASPPRAGAGQRSG